MLKYNIRRTFKYICTTRGKKLEQTNIKYGSFAQIIREGGFSVAIIIRYSAVPNHCVFISRIEFGLDLIYVLIVFLLCSCDSSFRLGRNEYACILNCGNLITAEAVHKRLHRLSLSFGKWRPRKSVYF